MQGGLPRLTGHTRKGLRHARQGGDELELLHVAPQALCLHLLPSSFQGCLICVLLLLLLHAPMQMNKQALLGSDTCVRLLQLDMVCTMRYVQSHYSSHVQAPAQHV